ncbi:hypothetical protein [Paraburkholderia aromaticivorans]|uniref:hypothetical protein n=1 Tax=Paraburkholderia aromaticivorans TaxID=2026199 RepID=UPI0012FE2CA6|nr:hypothetical protein [Paraburkholderia aromaticivorans]
MLRKKILPGSVGYAVAWWLRSDTSLNAFASSDAHVSDVAKAFPAGTMDGPGRPSGVSNRRPTAAMPATAACLGWRSVCRFVSQSESRHFAFLMVCYCVLAFDLTFLEPR